MSDAQTVPAADLHLHSNHSDGLDSPARVVERAAQLGIDAIALTDHDTTSGVPEALAAAERHGVTCIPGVEISTLFSGHEIHVVGLGVDLLHEGLAAGLRENQDRRLERIRQILARLGDAEASLSWEDVALGLKGPSPGRMHVAAALQRHGYTRTVQEGFDRYLNRGRPAHVPWTPLPIEDAIRIIHEAAGLAILAHPGLNKSTRSLLPKLLESGFDGIEAYHTAHTIAVTGRLLRVANEQGLLVSGGSDCHGLMKGREEMGRAGLPQAHLRALQARLQARA